MLLRAIFFEKFPGDDCIPPQLLLGKELAYRLSLK